MICMYNMYTYHQACVTTHHVVGIWKPFVCLPMQGIEQYHRWQTKQINLHSSITSIERYGGAGTGIIYIVYNTKHFIPTGFGEKNDPDHQHKNKNKNKNGEREHFTSSWHFWACWRNTPLHLPGGSKWFWLPYLLYEGMTFSSLPSNSQRSSACRS